MEEFIATFHIDWKLMIAQIINFLLVLSALYFLAAKPLKKLVKERTEEITVGLNDAKTNAEMLKSTKEEYEKMLQKARAEAQVIFENSKKEASDKKNEMLEKAKAEVAVIIENGKKTLESDKSKMINEAKNEVASLVIQATEKVLQGKNN